MSTRSSPEIRSPRKWHEATTGRPGSTICEIGLAVAVIVWHTVIVCYGPAAEVPFWSGWPRPFVFAIVPSFFALSGFLVAGSLVRNNLPAFLTLRAMRIYPALFFEVMTSAIVIGLLLSTVSVYQYLSGREFFTYLLNSVGYIHYELPGLFLDNPAGRFVNLQLWTIPYELECYVSITALALFGLARRPRLLLLAICLLTAISAGHDYSTLLINSRPPGRLLVLAFLSGVLLYVWRERISTSNVVFVIALALSWFLLSHKNTATVAALPVAYVTVWLGIKNPRRTILVAGADYSYGMYLYGFPVQQSLAYLFPGMRIWYLNGDIEHSDRRRRRLPFMASRRVAGDAAQRRHFVPRGRRMRAGPGYVLALGRSREARGCAGGGVGRAPLQSGRPGCRRLAEGRARSQRVIPGLLPHGRPVGASRCSGNLYPHSGL